MDATQGSGEQPPFVPFTKPERIQQLGEIDQSVVSLLRTAGQAIQSLGQKDAATSDGDVIMGGSAASSPSSSEDEDDEVDEELAREKALEKAKYKGKAVVFKREMNEFLRTLHSVNIRMRRQVWGLEETGIVTLPKEDPEDNNDQSQQQNKGNSSNKKIGGSGKDKDKVPVLEPDGNGKIGGINVGWLNTRTNKVERDMEAELWDQAEVFLRKMLEEAKDEGGDSHMA